MNAVNQVAITSLGRQIVMVTAPEELALFGPVSRAHFEGRTPSRRARNRDDLLGFGVGEAVVLLTPTALQFAQQFWESLADEAAVGASGKVVDLLRRISRRLGATELQLDDADPGLTVDQLQKVRSVGRRCAEALPLTTEQQSLFVEALVGSLAVPEPPNTP